VQPLCSLCLCGGLAFKPQRHKRIGIFVIAYNAVNKLDWTLDRIPQEVWDKVDEVFLFDDCSTDNTYYAAIGYKHAKTVEKLTIHRNAKNLRYGGNQKAGYDYAIARGPVRRSLLCGSLI
jgi:glycosyltransferase involved in cell wall biosynthesis